MEPTNESLDDVSDMEEMRSSLRLRVRECSRLTRYGSMSPMPTNSYPTDVTHGFFAKGRDFESVSDNHQYTYEEKLLLSTYENLDYLPPHSTAYKHWLKRQPSRLDWDRWVMMGLIGFTVGIVGFLVHQIVDLIAETKWFRAEEYIKDANLLAAWGWTLVYSVGFVTFGTFIVVFIRPSAEGSGIPELIGFLNGTLVRHIFNIKTMLVKFFSCCAVVGAGMPVGPEGPMIHMGSLIGAGVSQFKSETLHFKLPFFQRFRNSEDRRNFISAGAAAGVASAFGAPVGGLLFSMEEVSSFWNLKLSWQIFFCAMVSTFTTDLFNSAFRGFKYQGQFGTFRADNYIVFHVKDDLAVNILAFIPSMILGIMGGLLGSVFNFVNLKIARARKKTLAYIHSPWRQKAFRMIEPPLIMIIMATASVMLPALFKCTPFTCIYQEDESVSDNCLNSTVNSLRVQPTVSLYTCPEGETEDMGNHTFTNSTYNEMATLMFVTGEQAIHHLFSRDTHLQFGYVSMVATLVIYMFLACWAAGTSISSGLVVPMLLIGGLYGRILGRGMVDLFGIHTYQNSFWNWMDPGAFALIGAASFFGGVSRLTVSLTVIMMEITNDVQFLLPIMASVMVAKWVGDQLTHPLYHALLELKCIPYLDAEPVILHQSTTYVNLELFSANDIMTREVRTVRLKESVGQLARMLLLTSHGGFPVLNLQPSGKSTFFGTITRMELIILLKNEDIFFSLPNNQQNANGEDITHLDYQQMSIEVLSDPEAVEEMLTDYCNDTKYLDLFIDLEPYVNQSAVSVPSKFSLHRTYIIFRTLGLRHITVVDPENRVVGIITRKDLMGFNMEENLHSQLDTHLHEMHDTAGTFQRLQNEATPVADRVQRLDPAAADRVQRLDPAAADRVQRLDPAAADRVQRLDPGDMPASNSNEVV